MHARSNRLEIANALTIERDEPGVARRAYDQKCEHETNDYDNASCDTENAIEFHACAAGASIVFK